MFINFRACPCIMVKVTIHVQYWIIVHSMCMSIHVCPAPPPIPCPCPLGNLVTLVHKFGLRTDHMVIKNHSLGKTQLLYVVLFYSGIKSHNTS